MVINRNINEIIRLNRLISSYSLTKIVNEMAKYGAFINDTSTFSRCETGKLSFKIEDIVAFYKVLGIEYDEEIIEELDTEISRLFLEFLNNYFYGKSNESVLDRLNRIGDKVRMSSCYAKFLIIEMDNFLVTNTDSAVMYKYEKSLLDIEKSLSFEEKQLLYDTLGCFYFSKKDYQKALSYYDEAERYSDKLFIAKVLYHKSMILDKTGKLNDALEVIKQAKTIFDDYCCYSRSISSLIQRAKIESKMFDYSKAIENYYLSLKAAENLQLYTYYPLIYSNLCWVYIRKHEYDKIIDVCETMIDKNFNQASTYLYMSWAYKKMNNLEKAKSMISIAKDFITSSTKPLHILEIDLYEKILSGKASKKQIINQFNKIDTYFETQEVDYSNELFVLELRKDYFLELGDDPSAIFVMQRTLDILQNK